MEPSMKRAEHYWTYRSATDWMVHARDDVDRYGIRRSFGFPHELIERLNLEPLVETEAILADGSKVTLETFISFVDWFGDRIPLQVIAKEGQFPLLGTGLLEQRVLHID